VAEVWDEAIKVYSDLGQLKGDISSNDTMIQDVLARVPDRPKR
jgi:hypothetical protein